MRPLAAVLLTITLAGCAGFSRSQSVEGATIEALSDEIAKLPPSPARDRIEEIVADLDKELRQAAARRRGKADVDALMRLAAAAKPIQIEFGFATDGKDWSDDGSDDGLEIHLIPRDQTGSAVKCPGYVEVYLNAESALGLGMAGKQLDRWTISHGTLRYVWNESLFPAYIVRLPWHDGPPGVREALLTVTFHPIYGQTLTARKRVEIRTAPSPETPSSP